MWEHGGMGARVRGGSGGIDGQRHWGRRRQVVVINELRLVGQERRCKCVSVGMNTATK